MLSRDLVDEFEPQGVSFLAGLGSGLSPLHSLRTAHERRLAFPGWRSFFALGFLSMAIPLGALLFARNALAILAIGPDIARSFMAAFHALDNPAEAGQGVNEALRHLDNTMRQQLGNELLYALGFLVIAILVQRELRYAGFSELVKEWRGRLALSSNLIRWIEYSSRSDPVSSGTLLAGVADRVVEVANGPVVLMEHTGYWKNELLLLDMANELTYLLDPPQTLFTSDEYAGLQMAIRGRIKRVRRLMALRSILIYLVIGLVIHAYVQSELLLGIDPSLAGGTSIAGILMLVQVISSSAEAAVTRDFFELSLIPPTS